jgi:hypothetical protein
MAGKKVPPIKTTVHVMPGVGPLGPTENIGWGYKNPKPLSSKKKKK